MVVANLVVSIFTAFRPFLGVEVGVARSISRTLVSVLRLALRDIADGSID